MTGVPGALVLTLSLLWAGPAAIPEGSVPVNGSRCTACAGSEVQEPRELLCDPDPYEALCAKVGERRQKAFDAYAEHARIYWALRFPEKYEQFLFESLVRENPEALRHVMAGDWQADALRAATSSYLRKALERYKAEAERFSAKYDERMERIMDDVTRVFADLIDESKSFDKAQKAALKRRILACSDATSITYSSPWFGAFNSSRMRSTWREVMGEEEESSGALCEITLTPEMMVACAHDDAACFDTMAHEVAHNLNSCAFWEGYYDAWEESDEERGELGRISPVLGALTSSRKRANDFLGGIAAKLEEATSCLEVIGRPGDGVRNSCGRPRDARRSEAYFKRCAGPWNAVTGRPAQWSEAEADYWAASADALWLKSRYPVIADRRKFMEDAASFMCLDTSPASLFGALVSPDPDDSIEEDALLRGIRAALTGEPSCSDRPLKGAPPEGPIVDPHPAASVRINRYYLRNSDLRAALGCAVVDAGVPVACAPGREIRFVVPR